MIADTLLVLALALPPRPNLSRSSVVIAPAPAVAVDMSAREERTPETLTTCFQGRTGSCWSED